ncbi:MAG: WD40/YVTN/BNR-like repeat-containing protein [Candidatus Kapaibacterium sp.]|jgi:photosystem II stability/assembly factor-like uncharacterized protein
MTRRLFFTVSMVFLVAVCGITTSLNAQWTRVPTPFGEQQVSGLFIDGSTMYIGTRDSGVYKSPDKGATWVAVRDGLPVIKHTNVLNPWCFERSGEYLFAASGEEGIYRSSDNGSSWTRVDRLIYDGTIVRDTTFRYVNSLYHSRGRIFALGFDGIVSSSNNGDTWTTLRYRFGNIMGVTSAVSVGQDLYVSLYGDTTIGLPPLSSGIYKSSNLGEKWNKMNTGMPDNYIQSLATSDGYLYAGSAEGISISEDGGNSWVPVSTPMRITSNVRTIAARNSIVLAGSSGGTIIRSFDYGVTWSRFMDGLVGAGSIRTIVLSGPGAYACTDKGLYALADITSAPDDAVQTDATPKVVPQPTSSKVLIRCGRSVQSMNTRITDVLGNDVTNSVTITGGNDDHSFNCDFSACPAGVYSVIPGSGSGAAITTAITVVVSR